MNTQLYSPSRYPYRLAVLVVGMFITLIFGGVGGVGAVEIAAAPTTGSFIHTVSAANLVNAGDSVISHVLTNNNPNTLLFVTQNITPNGVTKPAQVGQVAVRYDDVDGRWHLRTVGGSFAAGASYNVYVSPVNANHWLHFDVNPVVGATELDYAAINNNPAAIIQVTNRAGGNVFNNHPIALQYDEGRDRWYIVNQDDEPMPDDVTFNIRLATPAQGAVLAFAGVESGYDGDDSLIISHDSLNGNPNAKFWITPQTTAIVNEYTYPVAAEYSDTLDRWKVTRLNNGNIAGGLFHLHIAPILVNFTTEVVDNGSFETPHALGDNRAESWSASEVHKGARKCNNVAPGKYVSFDGDCAYEFKGAVGVKSTLQQRVTFTEAINAGNTFNFSAYISGKGLTSGGKIQAIFVTPEGTKSKLNLDSAALNAGTYDYKRVETSLNSLFEYESVNIKIQMTGSTGKMVVDQFSLNYTKIEFVAPSLGQESLVPLPIAP